MKKITSCFLIFVLICQSNLFAQPLLEDVFLKYKYVAKSPKDIHFFNQSNNYLSLEGNNKGGFDWNKYTMDGKKIETWLSTNNLETWSKVGIEKIDNYIISPDDKLLLLATNKEQIFRKSYRSNFLIVNPIKKSVVPLSSNGKQMYPDFSSDGSKISFVRSNNIFYKDLLSGKEVQITFDGKTNEIINGASDWVYEEEFKVTQLYAWSPDGKKIAYLQFDESLVPDFSFTFFDELYPRIETFKYPKVGEKNSTIKAFVYDIKTKKTKEITPINGDVYMPKIEWMGNKVLITALNRKQNILKLFAIDPSLNHKVLIYEEKSSTYIDLPKMVVMDENRLLFTSEKEGFNHIYLLNTENGSIKTDQITSGTWEVLKIYGANAKDNWVYFQSNEGNIYERFVYGINLKTLKSKLISDNEGCNDAVFNSNFTFFISNHETDKLPNQYNLCSVDGAKLIPLETNEPLVKLIGNEFSKREFMEINVNGVSLSAYILKPSNFNPNKKYPLLFYVYGGPGKQEVLNEWGGFREQWFQVLAQKGYIIACVDNRGSGGKGANFKKINYLNLGKYETEDQIGAAQYFGKLPFIDSTRIGIFGWSYGGFMALNCLFYGAEKFKMAISVAPVSNWKYYDSVYSERYMGTMKENEGGYDNFNPIDGAKRMKGKLLLIHGMADDNVHFQNTVELQKALIEAGKQFDFMSYPDKNHSISGGKTRMHLFSLMTNYIEENL